MEHFTAVLATLFVVFAPLTPLSAGELDTFVVGTSETALSENPRVAVLPNGNALIVWREDDPAVDNEEIIKATYCRRLKSGGYKVGQSFSLSSPAAQVVYTPDVAARPDGQGFLVIWEARPIIGGVQEANRIQGHRIDRKGKKVGGVFTITEPIRGDSSGVIAPDPAGGGFVLAYMREDLAVEDSGLAIQQLDASGAPVGAVSVAPWSEPRDAGMTWYQPQRLRLLPDGAFGLSMTWIDPPYNQYPAYARIVAGYATQGWIFVTQRIGAEVDVAPVSVKFLFAMFEGKISDVLFGTFTRSIRSVTLKGKKENQIAAPYYAHSMSIVPDADGDGAAVFFDSGGTLQRMRVNGKGKIVGAIEELAGFAPGYAPFMRAALIPGRAEAFIVIDNLLPGGRHEIWALVAPTGE